MPEGPILHRSRHLSIIAQGPRHAIMSGMSPGRDDRSGTLFPAPAEDGAAGPARSGVRAPLAERVRPQTFEELLGQEDVLGPDKPLRLSIEKDAPPSLILWGPPGSGKTTLAHVIRRT